MRRRAGIAGLAAMVVIAVAATAGAAQAMTVSVGRPALVGRVSIRVPLNVACSPFDPSLTLFSEGASVGVEQPAGTSIAHGTGFVGSFLPDLLFSCDDSQHTVNLPVTADPAGPPFHGGPAVFNAYASAAAGTPCYPGSTNCYSYSASQAASTGPTKLNLH